MKTSIAVTTIHCDKTTKEIDRDEPYVLATAADIGSVIPNVDVTKYGPFEKVKKGDSRNTNGKAFWGLDGNAHPIASTESAIFVLSLVEHDASADANATREAVKLAAVGSLTASGTLDYATRVKKLVRDIKGALQIPTGAPNFDDPIGTKQLTLVIDDISGPSGTHKEKTLTFTGEGAIYKVTCRLSYCA